MNGAGVVGGMLSTEYPLSGGDNQYIEPLALRPTTMKMVSGFDAATESLVVEAMIRIQKLISPAQT